MSVSVRPSFFPNSGDVQCDLRRPIRLCAASMYDVPCSRQYYRLADWVIHRLRGCHRTFLNTLILFSSWTYFIFCSATADVWHTRSIYDSVPALSTSIETAIVFVGKNNNRLLCIRSTYIIRRRPSAIGYGLDVALFFFCSVDPVNLNLASEIGDAGEAGYRNGCLKEQRYTCAFG